jgi:hypothetical protein
VSISPEGSYSPFGDWELAAEKSEVAIGMDMDSWVAENEARLVFSSPRPGHDSLDFGHSSKKGRC